MLAIWTMNVGKYRIDEKVGNGTYGTVFRAQNTENGMTVALKRCERQRSGLWYTTVREISLLRELAGHPNITALYDVHVDTDSVSLVFDFFPMNLTQYLDSWATPLPTSMVYRIAQQLFSAVDYFHTRRIVHRDLKPDNILITRDLVLCVGDFGISRTIGTPNKRHTPNMTSLNYCCPELLLGEDDYTIGVDMWALGCIVGELFLRRKLFPGKNVWNQLDVIYRVLGTPDRAVWPQLKDLAVQTSYPVYPRVFEQLFQDVPFLFASITARLLQYDDTKRPGAGQLSDLLQNSSTKVMEVHHRSATYGDAPNMDRLNRQCLPENYSLLEWQTALVTHPDMCFVAYDGETLVGYVVCVPATQCTAFVSSLAVHPDYRRQGVATKLLEMCMDVALKKRMKVKLHVRKNNDAAQNLYGKLGFVPDREIQRYYSDGESALLMVKAWQNGL